MKGKCLVPVHGEREKDVARHAVAGGYVNDAVSNGGSGLIQRASVSLYTVHRFEVPRRVKVPKQFAIRRTVSAQMAVHGARKNDSGDSRCGRNLRLAAARLAHAGRLDRRGKPYSGSRLNPQGEKSTAGQRVFLEEIREREIEVFAVRGAAKFDSAEKASVADLALPNQFAFLIGIKRVDPTRLLGRDQQTMSAPERLQNWRRAKIVVGPRAFRTIRGVRIHAGEIPRIAR